MVNPEPSSGFILNCTGCRLAQGEGKAATEAWPLKGPEWAAGNRNLQRAWWRKPQKQNSCNTLWPREKSRGKPREGMGGVIPKL